MRDDRYRRQLTPQELQVALTLAEGATTREAAARLYLSPKTVEYHLRHVYDKLEVRTREEFRAAVMSETRPQSSRKALMFTDLAGSTSLVEAIGDDAWRNLSSWLDNEMRALFRENKGREVDHAGDGFFVVFESAADAIDCAVTIQRRLVSHPRDEDDGRKDVEARRLAHEPRILERAQRERHGRLRDADPARDLRAGDRRTGADGLEHSALVEVLEQRGGRAGEIHSGEED